ncbi:MAG: beta-propeller domain-containing protein [Acidimicrobiia bacterium]
MLAATVVGAVVAVAVVVAGPAEEAAASELARFTSCEELAAWQPAGGFDGDVPLATGGLEAAANDAAPAPAGTAVSGADNSALQSRAGSDAAGTGATNVAVEGVDELDVVDRVDDRRALVVAAGTMALVDLVDGARLASVTVPSDARVTYDADAGVAWVAGTREADSRAGAEGRGGIDSFPAGGIEISRVTVSEDGLAAEATWTSDGYLVDARRAGDRLHVVAVDGVYTPIDTVPFAGGPVPCDQVLHPVAPSGPGATLVATLPVSGTLEPVNATEIVGSGELVHVTASSAYVATPLYEEAGLQTGIHRFELDSLEHTGSGRVPGRLLNQFAMSEHDGFLRVAVTEDGFGAFIQGDVIVDEGLAIDETVVDTVGTLPAETLPAGPLPVEPGPGFAPEPEPSEAVVLNEVVVLDIDGELDVVGRTGRFGHPGETLHGIRFDGTAGYAVTFLTTDPFYVLDLEDPTAPQVVGEVELPGFSAYLHPLGDGLVAGFGPGEDGLATVNLFDVSDPAQPAVIDTEPLGGDSPVVYDHHAYLGLGAGTFAVPSGSWRPGKPVGCSPEQAAEKQAEFEALDRELMGLYSNGVAEPDPAVAEALSRRIEPFYGDTCLFPPSVAETTVHVVDAGAGTLDVRQRFSFATPEPGTRVLVVDDDRWAVVAGANVLVVDGAGAVDATIAIS